MEHRLDVASENELCPVCGDQVSGYHYGLLTCESCKGFFKRTVQNNKKYICAEHQQCQIDKSQRRRCPFCRFQKCLHVGMRLEAVRADRMRGGRNKFGPLYKRDRALKQWRRALMQASGFPVDGSPSPGCSAHLRDLQPVPVLHSTPLTITASDHMNYQTPTRFAFLPPSTPDATQYHCSIKSEHASGRSPGPAAGLHVDSGEGSPGPLPPQGPWMRQLVLEFLRWDPDELQLQRRISAHLQQQQLHGELSTFSLMCLMADQTLFFIVEWARRSMFFKQLKVNDQMKLLHSCWSKLLLLDMVSRQVLRRREGSLLLASGQEVELSALASQAGPVVASLVQRGQELVEELFFLKVDCQEFVCIKFLVLYDPDVKQLEDHPFIERVHEQTESALLDYMQHRGRLAQLRLCLSEVRSLSTLAEDYLYSKYVSGEMPEDSLLAEMLHGGAGRG